MRKEKEGKRKSTEYEVAKDGAIVNNFNSLAKARACFCAELLEGCTEYIELRKKSVIGRYYLNLNGVMVSEDAGGDEIVLNGFYSEGK